MILWMRNAEQNDYVISQSFRGITKEEGAETHSQPSAKNFLRLPHDPTAQPVLNVQDAVLFPSLELCYIFYAYFYQPEILYESIGNQCVVHFWWTVKRWSFKNQLG